MQPLQQFDKYILDLKKMVSKKSKGGHKRAPLGNFVPSKYSNGAIAGQSPLNNFMRTRDSTSLNK